MIKIGIASDNFRHDDRSLSYFFKWCKQNNSPIVELNTLKSLEWFRTL